VGLDTTFLELGVLFRAPHKLDTLRLIPVEAVKRNEFGVLALPERGWWRHEGFNLTDAGMNQTAALNQTN